MKLDHYQKLAAYHNLPYSCIIAGAGTGKTYTLLGRISYLVNEVGLKPEEIVVISYTNETVKEFQEKIHHHFGFFVRVFTFHKLAMYLLEQNHISYSLCQDSFLSFVINEFINGYVIHNSTLQLYFLQILFPFYNFFWKDFLKCKNSEEMKDLQNEMIRFIRIYYSKGYHFSWLLSLISNSYGKKKKFYILIFFIVNLYESELKSQNMVDFDSLILLAKESIMTIQNVTFRHILVDEFQDSSKVRIQFLVQLIRKFGLEFTVVGDDCQSIYRFSGTESNCFSLLQEEFPQINFFYLKYTYRNSQELISIANHFVLKNKLQLKKEILSFQHNDFPIEVMFYRKYSSIFQMMQQMQLLKNQNIIFLGRNSFDWKYYFSKDDIFWIDQKHFQLKQFSNFTFTFLTVHQSKGLEADVVILLHVEDGSYGFPNQILSSKYFSCFKSKQGIVFDEERRLFYVALTRTKGKIFLLVPFYHSSIFVKELIHDFPKKIKISFF